jgi:hypothetical protein
MPDFLQRLVAALTPSAMKSEDEPGDSETTKDKGAIGPFLVGSLASLVAILAALQITNDVVARMARNEPEKTAAMFGLIVFAIGCGAAVAALAKPAKTILGWIGLAAVVGGMSVAIWAALEVHGVEDAPLVSASLATSGESPGVTMSINATGVEDDEVVHIEVRGLRKDARARLAPYGETLYSAAVGPNPNGDVDQDISTRLPSSEAEYVQARAWIGDKKSSSCLAPNQDDRTGCVLIKLAGPSPPEIAASMAKQSDGARRIDVTISGGGAARPPIYVTATRFGARANPFYANKINAARLDGADRKLSIVVPPKVSTVCISARRAEPIGRPRRQCTSKDRAASWVRVRVS